MEYFVKPESIVRRIWGKSDTVLFIFAGAAAEFALNKAVDWLYFTGKLPNDPIGRLFSTVAYARNIIFSSNEEAIQTIEKINSIHDSLERKRGIVIPTWAYRDVLYMLIHYSIASFERLERKLTDEEKDEVFDVFYRFGHRMHIRDLAENFDAWKQQRLQDMENDLQKTELTVNLFQQYKKHLGSFRYQLLLEVQKMIVPDKVRQLLSYDKTSLITPVLPVYKASRYIGTGKTH